MRAPQICILYKPKLYKDLFSKLIQLVGGNRIEEISLRGLYALQKEKRDDTNDCIVVLPLDETGTPETTLLPEPAPEAKLIAFSVQGDRGFRRSPGHKQWEEVHPYGLNEMFHDVFGDPEPHP